jgi:hypothetical protein
MKLLLSLLFYSLFFLSNIFSLPVDEENLKVLMKENKEHFEFINIVLSNMIKPQAEPDKLINYQYLRIKPEVASKRTLDKDDSYYFTKFLEGNMKDNEAAMLYLKADYELSHKPMKFAQKNIKELYEDSLERHNEHTRVLLAYVANRVIKSNDFSSKYLLKLAFKQLTVAEDSYTLGWNQAPHQYRLKISHYQDGFQASRNARRFALLSIMNYKTENEDKYVYKKQSLSEMKNSINEGRVNDYEFIKVYLRNFIENKLIDGKIAVNVPFERPRTSMGYEFKENLGQKLDLMEMLDDAYGFISYNRISILDETNNVIKKESPGPSLTESNAKNSPSPNPNEVKTTNPTTPTNTGDKK